MRIAARTRGLANEDLMIMAKVHNNNATQCLKAGALVCMPHLIQEWPAPPAMVTYERDQHAIVLEQLIKDPFPCGRDFTFERNCRERTIHRHATAEPGHARQGRRWHPLDILNAYPGPVCFYQDTEARVLRLRAWTACLEPGHRDDLVDLIIAHAQTRLRSHHLRGLLEGN